MLVFVAYIHLHTYICSCWPLWSLCHVATTGLLRMLWTTLPCGSHTMSHQLWHSKRQLRSDTRHQGLHAGKAHFGAEPVKRVLKKSKAHLGVWGGLLFLLSLSKGFCFCFVCVLFCLCTVGMAGAVGV